jgi:hypothetical protein
MMNSLATPARRHSEDPEHAIAMNRIIQLFSPYSASYLNAYADRFERRLCRGPHHLRLARESDPQVAAQTDREHSRGPG